MRMLRPFLLAAAVSLALSPVASYGAAPTSTPYNEVRYLAGSGAGVNFATDTIKCILLSSSYSPNYTVATGQKFLSDVSTYQVATNLASATITVAGKTWTEGSSKYVFSSSAVVFTASGGSVSARYMVCYKDTGTASTSPLLFLVLMDSTPADVTITSGGTLTLTPDATNGWLYY